MNISYEGITKEGEKIKGSFLGTKQELISYLRKEGILLVSVKEENKKLKKGKYKIDQLIDNLEQLSYLISAGVEIDKAISYLIKNLSKKSAFEFWTSVLNELKRGKSFSASLWKNIKEYGLSLNKTYISIIEVGEEVGNLPDSLKRLIELLRLRKKIIREVKSALSYPAFLFSITIIAIICISCIIIPRFSSIFSPTDMEKLPLISKLIFSLGNFINRYIYFILFSIPAVPFLLSLFHVDLFRIINSLLWKISFLRNLFLKLEFANFFSSIGVMLNGGVSIEKAIKFGAEVVDFHILKNIAIETSEGIKKGMRISSIWQKYPIIPEEIVLLIYVGENSASLDDILKKLGERYFSEFEKCIKKYLIFLEPFMILILGFFIAVTAIAIMLAVLSLTNVA